MLLSSTGTHTIILISVIQAHKEAGTISLSCLFHTRRQTQMGTTRTLCSLWWVSRLVLTGNMTTISLITGQFERNVKGAWHPGWGGTFHCAEELLENCSALRLLREGTLPYSTCCMLTKLWPCAC